MAGKYVDIFLNDWSSDVDESGPYLEGQTHGCSCCSSNEKVTKQDLLDHISKLKEEIEDSEKLVEEYFK